MTFVKANVETENTVHTMFPSAGSDVTAGAMMRRSGLRSTEWHTSKSRWMLQEFLIPLTFQKEKLFVGTDGAPAENILYFVHHHIRTFQTKHS